MSRHLLAAIVAAAGLISAPVAQAAEACWTPEAIGAARVQEFEAMLMSVSLRCKTGNVDLSAQFERFRENHRVRLESAFRVLGEHFQVERSKQNKLELDHFLIQQGNRFGSGRSDAPTCRGFAAVLGELGGPRSVGDTLETFALAMVRDPYLDGPRCPVRHGPEMAVREPARVSGGAQAGR